LYTLLREAWKATEIEVASEDLEVVIKWMPNPRSRKTLSLIQAQGGRTD
jgi:hypothetical protein